MLTPEIFTDCRGRNEGAGFKSSGAFAMRINTHHAVVTRPRGNVRLLHEFLAVLAGTITALFASNATESVNIRGRATRDKIKGSHQAFTVGLKKTQAHSVALASCILHPKTESVSGSVPTTLLFTTCSRVKIKQSI